jgi:hypothetical protein
MPRTWYRGLIIIPVYSYEAVAFHQIKTARPLYTRWWLTACGSWLIKLSYTQIRTKHMIFQVLSAASMKFRVFWDVAQFSVTGVDWRFRDAYCLLHQGALMMKAVRTSETSVHSNEATRRYFPEDCELHVLSSMFLEVTASSAVYLKFL